MFAPETILSAENKLHHQPEIFTQDMRYQFQEFRIKLAYILATVVEFRRNAI